MTNEDWIEELFHEANQIGVFKQMHPKIGELQVLHPDLKYVELVELAFMELRRKHEESTEKLSDEDLQKYYIKYAAFEDTDDTYTFGEFKNKIRNDENFRKTYIYE
jgi:hypothetical protein